MQLKVSHQVNQSDCTNEEWQARVDLAAAHRIANMHGLNEGIFNHLTLVVPGKSDRYYQIPFGTHWSEVCASTFMEVGFDGKLLRGAGTIERSCYCIHAPIHRSIAKAKAVFHTHMPFASALTRLEDMRILPTGQTEMGISASIAYDEHYMGPATDPSEGDRLVEAIGDKSVLFMANHGVTVTGPTVADAYNKLYYVERAAQVQVYAMMTGRKLRMVSDEMIEKTKKTFGGVGQYDPTPPVRHFEALKRILDRKEPDYKD